MTAASPGERAGVTKGPSVSCVPWRCIVVLGASGADGSASIIWHRSSVNDDCCVDGPFELRIGVTMGLGEGGSASPYTSLLQLTSVCLFFPSRLPPVGRFLVHLRACSLGS